MLFEPIKPMLLHTNDVAFDDINWLHELKLDGAYSCISKVNGLKPSRGMGCD